MNGNFAIIFEKFKEFGGDFEKSSADMKNKLAVRYSVNSWDGKSESGVPVSTGVYFVKFLLKVKEESGDISTRHIVKSFYYLR